MSDTAPAVASGAPSGASPGELQDLLLASESVENFLELLVKVAVDAIGSDLSAAITVGRDGHPATVASSDEFAAQLDEVQYGNDDGPCLTAMRAGRIVLVEDLDGDDRFAAYRLRALALGLRSSLSLPLDGGDHAVGALNLYSRHTDAFGPAQRSEAQRFADEASRVLTLAVRLIHDVEITDQLRAALTSRTVIDQAIGVVMGQNRCDADAAFAVLRAASQNRNIKLRVIAAEILAAIGTKVPTQGRPFME